MNELYSLVSGALLLLLPFLFISQLLAALQSAAVEGSSRALILFRKDTLLLLSFILTLAGSLLLLLSPFPNLNALFLILGVLFLVFFTLRCKSYLDPYGLLNHLESEAKEVKSPLKQRELCDLIDGVTEVISKALWQRSLGLARSGLTSFQSIMKEYIQGKGKADLDSVNFTTIYLLERLSLLFDQSLESRLGLLASHIAGETLKVTLPLARFDRGVAALPLYFADQLLKRAREEEALDVVGSIESAEIELAKTLTRSKGLNGVEMLLLTLISSLEELVKENFKRDKQSSIPFLMQPFKELKEECEKSALSDKDSLINELNRILTEFEALQSVLLAVPNIPGYEKQEAAIKRE